MSELVMALAGERRALCLMGNHEYNLVAFRLQVPGYELPKPSYRDTIADVETRPDRWGPVLDFFRDLPVAIALPGLRVIHACWHVPSLEAVLPLMGVARGDAGPGGDAVSWLRAHVALRSPFEGEGLIPGLPGDTADLTADIPHENLMKSYEIAAPRPFRDADGAWRDHLRPAWWLTEDDAVVRDRPQVFGHYWHAPPHDGVFAPPFPVMTREFARWARTRIAQAPLEGEVDWVGNYACIDMGGLTRLSDAYACVGALRWPQRRTVWSSAPKEAARAVPGS